MVLVTVVGLNLQLVISIKRNFILEVVCLQWSLFLLPQLMSFVVFFHKRSKRSQNQTFIEHTIFQRNFTVNQSFL